MIRQIARPMIAAVYVADGVDTVRNSKEHIESTDAVVKHIRTLLPQKYERLLPRDPQQIAKIAGSTKAVCGCTLALGVAPRLSTLGLTVVSLPTMIGRHAFWEAKDKKERESRRSGFLTDLALLGGLMIATADTQGKPGLAWRANKAATLANKNIQKALPTKSETESAADSAREWLGEAQETVSNLADNVTSYVDENKDDWKAQAVTAGGAVAAAASALADNVTSYVDDNKDDWLSTAQDNAKLAKKRAVKAAAKAQERANVALAEAEKTSGRASKKADKRSAKLRKQADKALKRAQKRYGQI